MLGYGHHLVAVGGTHLNKTEMGEPAEQLRHSGDPAYQPLVT